MKIGLSTHWRWGETQENWLDRVRAAGELGYHFVGVADTQSVSHDVYACLALVATVAQRTTIGPMVTNTVTRHPAVTASAICTINDIADGGAVLALGRGGSAVQNIGDRATPIAKAAEYIRTVKALLANEPASWMGRRLHSGWAPSQTSVPLFVSAGGPRMRELAGAFCDGAILTSLSRESTSRAVSEVRAAAVANNRDPDAIRIWVLGRMSVRDDRAEAIKDLKPLLASSFHNVRPGDPEVPAELTDAFAELRRRYDARSHGAISANCKLIDDLDLTDYLANRFAIAGSPIDCARRIDDLADAGVECVVLNDSVGGPMQTIVRTVDEVVPLLSGPTGVTASELVPGEM